MGASKHTRGHPNISGYRVKWVLPLVLGNIRDWATALLSQGLVIVSKALYFKI